MIKYEKYYNFTDRQTDRQTDRHTDRQTDASISLSHSRSCGNRQEKGQKECRISKYQDGEYP